MNQYSIFIESLKRLYHSGKLDVEKIVELFKNGKITEQEKWYIINE